MNSLKKVTRTKVYREVISALIEMIKDEKLSKGQKLPTEREIAEQCGVSRSAVREGLSVLESAGYIEVKPRVGITINKKPDSDFEAEVHNKLSDALDALEILEVRSGLECQAAYLAAERRTDRHISVMAACFRKLEQMTNESGYEEDFAFHYSIAVAAQNGLLLRIFDTISERYKIELQKRREWARDRFGLYAPSLDEHRAILAAIIAQKPQASQRAMQKHLNNVKLRLQENCEWSNE